MGKKQEYTEKFKRQAIELASEIGVLSASEKLRYNYEPETIEK